MSFPGAGVWKGQCSVTFIEGHQSDNKIGKYPFVIPRCDSHRNCVWLTRLTRASNRFDSLARSIRSNLPQCLTTGAMRRIDLACRLTETVAELVSSRFAFKATGPAPQLQLLFSRPPYPHRREADSDLYQRQRLNTEFTGLSRG